MSDHYAGQELALFAAATHWKGYIGAVLRPFVSGRVLEVGAGLGSNVPYLWNDAIRSWICLEPDRALAGRIGERLAEAALPPACRAVCGTLACIDADARFETILYLDVLEHIAEDREELALARRRLVEGGRLIVLAPAHQFLFTRFDAAIGHYRRYGRASLAALAPPDSELIVCALLDCAGFFASLANRLLLRAALPSPRQIAVWDRVMVPISGILDRGLGHRLGKTVLAVWRPRC